MLACIKSATDKSQDFLLARCAYERLGLLEQPGVVGWIEIRPEVFIGLIRQQMDVLNELSVWSMEGY